MEYGYARTSTEDQRLDRQTHALTEAGAEELFSDRVSGGVDPSKRPGWARLSKRLEPGDRVTVLSLDRLGRSVIHTMTLLDELTDRGIEFRSLRESVDTRSPQGRMVVSMIAAVAEMQRGMIRESVTEGLDRARARGSTLGRRHVLGPGERSRLQAEHKAGVTVPELQEKFGVSRATVYREISR